MKSCRNCQKYKLDDDVCKLHGNIIDKTIATYCSKYSDRRHIAKGKVKCVNCSEMNKYGWCNNKRRCFTEEERFKERTCSKFKVRKPKNIKKPKKK